ncbi:MAG: GDP-mannose 4,6-dehydratase [Candidatus Levyibacteriota bacterium]|nr:MAG: GDP-mannose 4,6-dehydratase [Candidatus Levybacteria bacterium]
MEEKVLITGITGFTGSHMADYILSKGIKVYGLKRWNLSRLRNIAHILSEVEFFDCDLTDPIGISNIIEKIKPTKIFHFAAESGLGPSWTHPSHYMDVNYKGTLNLLEAVRKANITPKILISSSVAMYGDIPKEHLPMREETPLNPLNPYAVSKIAQDYIGYVYHKTYGLHIVRTRAFNIEGPRRDNIFGLPWYAYQIALIEAGKQKSILESGYVLAKRNFIHVKDIVNAYWLALKHCKPEVYLVGSDKKENIGTFDEVIKSLIKKSTFKGEIEHKVIEKFIRVTNETVVIGDCRKFYAATGWKPKLSFEDIIDDVLVYWRNFVKKDLY